MVSQSHGIEVFGFVLSKDALDSEASAKGELFSSGLKSTEILKKHVWDVDLTRRKIVSDLL